MVLLMKKPHSQLRKKLVRFKNSARCVFFFAGEKSTILMNPNKQSMQHAYIIWKFSFINTYSMSFLGFGQKSFSCSQNEMSWNHRFWHKIKNFLIAFIISTRKRKWNSRTRSKRMEKNCLPLRHDYILLSIYLGWSQTNNTDKNERKTE